MGNEGKDTLRYCVRIDKLIKEADFKKATFYYYFKSKQTIFEAVMTQDSNVLPEK